MRYYVETRTGTEVEISREALADFLTTGILTRVEGGPVDALDALASYLARENAKGADSGGYLLEGLPVFRLSPLPEILYPVRIVLLPGGEAEDGYVSADGTFIPATFESGTYRPIDA